MDTTKAQQKALDDALVAPKNRLKIGKYNQCFSPTLKSNEPTIQVALDALKLTPFYNAFEVSADVPKIYMQKFWATVTKHHFSLRFKMNRKRHTVNVDNFRDMLKICPKLPGQKFEDPPFEEEILSFIRDLRHTCGIKCLSGKTTALESLHLSRAQILWGMYHNKNVDYVYLLWEDLVYQVENKNSKKNNDMYYLCFTKVIVDYFMAKDRAIPRRNKMFWHYARDDLMFTTIRVISKHQDTQVYGDILPQHLTKQDMLESKAYKTYHAYATGEKTPKPKSTKKKVDFESSPKTKPTQASKGKRIKTSAKGVILAKKKQSATNSHASGSGANEGTGITTGVPDVPTYESDTEQISWKSIDEEDDNEAGMHDDNDDNDDNDDDTENQDDDDQEHDDQDDEEQDGVNELTNSNNDGDEFVHPKLSTHDEEDKEEEDSYPRVHTPSNYKSTNDEEIQGANVGGEEMDVEETNEEDEVNELYRDVNVNLEERDTEMTDAPRTIVQTTQVIEDTHNLYKALVDAYKSEKLILDTYGETVSFKRRRDVEDKDEEPFAGSNRGSKRRRMRKEPESTSAPKEKTSNTTRKSTEGFKSHQKSADEFAQAEEPMQTAKDLKEPAHQEFKTRVTKDQPDEEPLSFLIGFKNQQNLLLPIMEDPLGPTFELKGSCKSLAKLEYFFEEVYKVTTDQLDWNNPEGQQYSHDLRKPLPLIPNSRGRRVIPFYHFINNDLAYLSGGVSSRTYSTSVTKTKVADYGHIKWIEDLVPNTMWSQVPVSYDKHALWESYIGGENDNNSIDLLVIGNLLEMSTPNAESLDDDKLYTFKEGDFNRLRIQDIEDMLILLVQGKLTNLTVKERLAFNNKDKKNRLMRIDELHKFSDDILNDVQTALNDHLNGIRMKYLPQTIWRQNKMDSMHSTLSMYYDYDAHVKGELLVMMKNSQSVNLLIFISNTLIELFNDFGFDCDGIPERPTMYLNLWSYKVVRYRYSNPMIQPEPEGSTQGYPLDSVEVLRFYTSAGNPVNEILLKLNLPDHRILKNGHGGIPTVLPTVPPSLVHTLALPNITPASPDYSPAFDTESDLSEDPSLDHIPPLPAISPFLSLADNTIDSDTLDTPPSPTHGTSFTDITPST
ncbi:hypothetical protein Tco_0976003 [Tanacetum coccineum]|uniref:Uncharacterized protein n=1 Tax=Tanacetum coccineum TaxID=301880 RepID=A0ABQ5EG11_9ASTR